MRHLAIVITSSVLLLACGGEPENPQPQSGAPDQGPAQEEMASHGEERTLGKLVLVGKRFEIVQLGELVPGKEGAFEVHAPEIGRQDKASLNLYLWVESQDGTQLSAPGKGSLEGEAFHFHVTPRAADKEPHRVVLRLRAGGADERGGLPLDGHGHEHAEGPHDGVPATFSGGDVQGHLELKLHDDKGDLELWLANDANYTEPFDLPLGTSIEVEFIDKDGRKIKLRPRNQEQNEDEQGQPNVRSGKTNYFIYPGPSGEDASWLKGKEFQSIVVVRFERDGVVLESEEFVLRPHTH